MEISVEIVSYYMSCADQLVRRGVKQVTTSHREMWTGRIRKLLVQSKFLDVIDLQEADLTWKSIRFQLPRGQLKFMMQSSIDCAPTQANLKRMRRVISPRVIYVAHMRLSVTLSTTAPPH